MRDDVDVADMVVDAAAVVAEVAVGNVAAHVVLFL